MSGIKDYRDEEKLAGLGLRMKAASSKPHVRRVHRKNKKGKNGRQLNEVNLQDLERENLITKKFDPHQRRDHRGRWTDTHGMNLDLAQPRRRDVGENVQYYSHDAGYDEDQNYADDDLTYNYSGDGYSDEVTHLLRNNEPDPEGVYDEEELGGMINALDRTADRHILAEDTSFYRIVPKAVYDNPDVDEVTDPAFMSTTTFHQIARKYRVNDDDVIVRFDMPKGSHVIPHRHNAFGESAKGEFIIPRGIPMKKSGRDGDFIVYKPSFDSVGKRWHFDPMEPRDHRGRWTRGGGPGLSMDAPNARRSHRDDISPFPPGQEPRARRRATGARAATPAKKTPAKKTAAKKTTAAPAKKAAAKKTTTAPAPAAKKVTESPARVTAPEVPSSALPASGSIADRVRNTPRVNVPENWKPRATSYTSRTPGVRAGSTGTTRKLYQVTIPGRSPRRGFYSKEEAENWAETQVIREAPAPLPAKKTAAKKVAASPRRVNNTLFDHSTGTVTSRSSIPRINRGGTHIQQHADGRPIVTRPYTDPGEAYYQRNAGPNRITNERLKEIFEDPSKMTLSEKRMIASAGGSKNLDGEDEIIVDTSRGPRALKRYDIIGQTRSKIAPGSGNSKSGITRGGLSEERRKKMAEKRRESGKPSAAEFGKIEKQITEDWSTDGGESVICVFCGKKMSPHAMSVETPKPKALGGNYRDRGGRWPAHHSCNTKAGEFAQKDPIAYQEEMMKKFNKLPLETRKRLPHVYDYFPQLGKYPGTAAQRTKYMARGPK